MRSIETRPSTRASGARGGNHAASERHVFADVLAVEAESCGSSNRRGSRLAAPGNIMTIVPAGMSTPAMVAGLRASRESLLTGSPSAVTPR